jgi:hypothetical protein
MSPVAALAEPVEIVKTVIPLTRLYPVCLMNDVIASWPDASAGLFHRKPGKSFDRLVVFHASGAGGTRNAKSQPWLICRTLSAYSRPKPLAGGVVAYGSRSTE